MGWGGGKWPIIVWEEDYLKHFVQIGAILQGRRLFKLRASCIRKLKPENLIN